MAQEKFIPSELNVKATASLNEEVKKELEVEDPDEEKAKAILEGKEEDETEAEE